MGKRDNTLFLPPIPEGNPGPSRVIPWQRWGEYGGMAFTRAALEKRDYLVLSDNRTLLNALPDGIIDLVYIDPPFATGKHRESPQGEDGPQGFDDSFESPEEFTSWLAPILRELWRVLTINGNLVIHLDYRAIHHIRLWCDEEFGSERLENEIIWHYTGGGRSKLRFSRKHDVLLWYSKGKGRTFNIDAVRVPYKPTSGYAKGGIVSRKGKKYMPHPNGTPVDDVWEIPIVNPLSNERTAYPTQKPLRLLERIITGLSNESDIVCDVFSGSGTTAVAARMHGRRFLCCDRNIDTVGITVDRLAGLDSKGGTISILSNGFYVTPKILDSSCKDDPDSLKSELAKWIGDRDSAYTEISRDKNDRLLFVTFGKDL